MAVSAAEEVDAELARIASLLADARSAVVGAQSQWEGREQALAVVQSTSDPEVAPLLAEHQQVADALVTAWQRVAQAQQSVEGHRRLVGAADAIATSGPNIPCRPCHPPPRFDPGGLGAGSCRDGGDSWKGQAMTTIETATVVTSEGRSTTTAPWSSPPCPLREDAAARHATRAPRPAR